jgi:hypothetical protein
VCIGIEALLTNDSIEIAHKIATRGAAALTRHRKLPTDPAIAFKMLKAVYSRRSDLVHDDTKAKNVEFKVNENTRFRTVELASCVLRELLLSKLNNATTWTIVSLDEELLTSLLPPNDSHDAEEAEQDKNANSDAGGTSDAA